MVIQGIFNNSSRLLEQKAYPETQYRITSQEIHDNIFSYFCTRKWYRQQSMRFQPRLSIICDYRAIQNIKHPIIDAQSKINGKTFGYIRLF